jgi:micrococcal nuclease
MGSAGVRICWGVLLVLLPLVAHAEFWASAKAQRYHKPSCRWVARIAPEYRVKFATREAAWAAGYQPCEVCRPPGFAAEPKKRNSKNKPPPPRPILN